MRHLFSSRVAVYRLESTPVDGILSYAWTDSGVRIDGRLDLNFIRPGKDQLPPVEAGKAQDRVGLFICGPSDDLRAGDRLVAVANRYGRVPVSGTFEVRAIPDVAQDYAGGHHIEVQVVEVAQALAGVFPGSE